MSHPKLLTDETERRLSTRIPVNERATLLQGHLGSSTHCTLIDMCLDGCRLRVDGELRVDHGAKVELVFRLCGAAFRLSGVTEWTGRAQEVGVSFREVSPRREAELVEALGELAGKLEAKRAEEARADEARKGLRGTVERLTAELERKRGREAEARAEAEQAASEALHAQETLEAAKKDLAKAERAMAERARSVAAEIGPARTVGAPPADLQKPKGDGGMPRPAPTGRERRRAARHAVDSTATIFLVDVRSNVSGRIVDVSMSGCRIRLPEKFPVGIYRRVEVEFLLDGLPFRLPGVVQSLHDRFTAGIRFVDLSERKQEQLSFVMEEITQETEEGETKAG
ncbi:MAG TPA: PilZ domain-containing protein [Terracidiphilus sp.]|nr:PilZ domain-containing protein [Terracidiphilus sp.]